jgi:branched-chain amino acid transport system ATP-binding protein
MSAAAPLAVEELSAGYGATEIVEGASFAVPAGGRLAVLGRNGVGKTTLLAALMGLARRQAGRILLDGRDIAGLATPERARLGLGYVPQTRDVFRSLTVEENLIAGLKDRPRAALDEAYAMFPRLGERRRQTASLLSGGEQQMLSTARTVLGRPRVLLLDEPLEGLAPVICDELMAALHRLTESGSMTILLVEQQIERAFDFAPETIVMDRGRIVWSGPTAALRGDRDAVERHLGVGSFH